jgi:methyl-accepting chemotaxis protein
VQRAVKLRRFILKENKMSAVFAPAISILNKIPNAYKVIILFVISQIPCAIFAFMYFDGLIEPAVKNGLYALAGSTLIVFMYFTYAYHLSLKSNFSALSSVLHRMGEGDMSTRMEITNKDEMRIVATEFNHMVEKFEALVQQISSATAQLAAASEEMDTVARNAGNNITNQTRETEQVATAMNQMTATVQEVANNASSAAGAANNADNEAKGGKEIVLQTSDAIQQLATSVEQSAEVIHQLETDSDNIGTVLDVIKSIAEQTNLLALNAAIEAARAGEQGRGFAVVADEVRTLASRTQESTNEIQDMIEKLQSGSRNAVAVMEQGRALAQSGVDQAREAAESLEAITRAVTTINEMNNMIASAAEEQTSVAEEMNKNINNISQLSNDTAGAANQTMAASSELSKLSSQLDSLINQFKLSS